LDSHRRISEANGEHRDYLLDDEVGLVIEGSEAARVQVKEFFA